MLNELMNYFLLYCREDYGKVNTTKTLAILDWSHILGFSRMHKCLHVSYRQSSQQVYKRLFLHI